MRATLAGPFESQAVNDRTAVPDELIETGTNGITASTSRASASLSGVSETAEWNRQRQTSASRSDRHD